MVTNVHRVFLTAVFILWAFAVVPVPSLASHSWGGYHWARTGNQFTLQLGDNVSSSWVSPLTTASLAWNVSFPLETKIVAGSTKARKWKTTSGCGGGFSTTNWKKG